MVKLAAKKHVTASHQVIRAAFRLSFDRMRCSSRLFLPQEAFVSNPADRLSGQQTHCAPSDEAGGRRALAHASIEFKEKSRISAEENHRETPERRRGQNRAEAPVAGRISIRKTSCGVGRNAHDAEPPGPQPVE